MTNIDVIEMVRQIADPEKTNPWEARYSMCVLTKEELERLIALVRADAIAEEREACAKVCEVNHHTVRPNMSSFECAAAIRARSNT